MRNTNKDGQKKNPNRSNFFVAIPDELYKGMDAAIQRYNHSVIEGNPVQELTGEMLVELAKPPAKKG